MSDYQKYHHSGFAKYDCMMTETLEEILRLDAQKNDDEESDLDMLMYIMGILAERRRKSDNPGKKPEDSWRSFVDNYYPELAEE